jgi:hypothetical protein
MKKQIRLLRQCVFCNERHLYGCIPKHDDNLQALVRDGELGLRCSECPLDQNHPDCLKNKFELHPERDGSHGMCANAAAAEMLKLKRRQADNQPTKL